MYAFVEHWMLNSDFNPDMEAVLTEVNSDMTNGYIVKLEKCVKVNRSVEFIDSYEDFRKIIEAERAARRQELGIEASVSEPVTL